jgi:hypothetical protein
MLGDGWVMLGFGQATAKLAARHRGSAVLGIAALPAKHFAGLYARRGRSRCRAWEPGRSPALAQQPARHRLRLQLGL